MSTYLVTGAAGFIAAKVCDKLIAAGHTVVGIDNLNDYYDVRLKDYRLSTLLDQARRPSVDSKVSSFAGQNEQIANESRRFIFRHLDIENIAGLEELFSEFRFDAVFNLAARAGVRYSLVNPHIYLTTNAHGTLNLLETQRKHGVTKHVLASTSSLYAGCPMPFHEDLPVNTPNSPYAASKKAAEVMAYAYHKHFGLDVTVLRYFTVFGPAGRPDMAPFRFIKWIAEDTEISLYGDGLQARDFTYVDDIAFGTISAVKPLGYEIINLGGGNNPVSLRKIIAVIEALLEKPARLDVQPFNAVDMKETWADISKARLLLGWVPSISVEDGLRRAVDWYRDNADWLREIKV